MSDNRLTPVGYIQSTNLVVTSKCLIDPRRICEGDWTPASDAENSSSSFWQVPGLPSSHLSRQALTLTSSYFMLWSIGKWTWVLGLYQHSSFQAFPFIFDSTVEMILKATLLFYWQWKIKLWGNTSLGNFSFTGSLFSYPSFSTKLDFSFYLRLASYSVVVLMMFGMRMSGVDWPRLLSRPKT